MKILHTSDWHLGHTLYNYDRLEEQTDMLCQITEIVRAEQPDVFILSGDVYHTSQPSATTQRLYADAMTDLHLAAPDMQIFVTAGNHDSPSRHDIFTRPWQALNVTTIGSIIGMDPKDLIFHIPNKGYVIAVPYVHWRNMPENLYKELTSLCEEMNTDNLPVVMMAHAAVSGVSYRGHDHSNDFSVGGIDCVNPEYFGSGFDYLALGHIHKPQTIRKDDTSIRYSGSPMAVSFDEDYVHSVSLIEITDRGSSPDIRTIEINNIHPLITLPADSACDFEKIISLLSDYPDNLPAYLRLNVEIDDFLPLHAREKVMQVIKNKKVRFCTFNLFRKNLSKTDSSVPELTVNEFKEIEPLEVARRFAAETGSQLTEEQLGMLSELFTRDIAE